MKKNSLKGLLLLFPVITNFSFRALAQEKDSIEVALQPVVITASGIPTNSLYVGRTIDVIDEQTIRSLGASSVEEVLQRESNIHIQSRGMFGVQSDASIRGALFSQQLILLNSVRMNNAQTAHHNFDLPVSLDQIERIEVLKGAGSALYGSDAYGGVINIITRTPEQQSLSLKFSGGEYGLADGSATYDFVSPHVHSSNNIEHRRSDGYQYDTDFQMTSVSSSSTFDSPFGTYSLLAGYTNKEFGAFNFYGISPSREWTETTFLDVTTKVALSSILFQPKLSYRRHYDKFMYDLRIPDQFVNINTTNSYSGELQSVLQAYESISVIAGVNETVETITSSNLHNHQQSSIGILMTVQSVLQKKILFDLGAREDFHSEYGNQFNPTINVGYLFSSMSKVFLTAGRSFRSPSYTELYYTSPSRIGNPLLQPETGWSYEVGTDVFLGQQTKFSLSFFDRDQENLIDYVKFSSTEVAYQAINYSSAVTRGIEAAFQLRRAFTTDQESVSSFTLTDFLLNYTYLDSKINVGTVFSSLYSFNHPRHQLNAVLTGFLPFAIQGTLSAAHKIKLNGARYTLVDAKFSRQFYSLTVFVQGTNLLNQSYEEIVGVPLPGRWLWAGVEFKVL